MIVLAGGLQKEFRYRIAATHQDATKKRVLIVAAEDYKGVSPNVTTAGYDTAPRYLDEYKSALEALGYEVSDFDVDTPPPTGGTPNGVVFPQIKYPTYLGVLSHFDAVVYESGDDFIPQDITNTNPRRMTNADGADRLAGDGAVVPPRDARAARLRQRGRQADRRRPQRPPGRRRRPAPA